MAPNGAKTSDPLAELRTSLETAAFDSTIRAYDALKQAQPEAQLPEELAAIEAHCRIGLRTYRSARRVFEQWGSSGTTGLIEELLEKKSYPKVLAHVAKALESDPFCAPALEAAAEVDRAQGNLAGATEKLRQAVRGEPAYKSGWYALACCRATALDKDEALRCLATAMRLDRALLGSQYYHRRALEAPDFAALRDDHDVIRFCDPLPIDPELRSAFQLLRSGEYDKAYDRARELMEAGYSNRAPLVDVMEHSLTQIMGDLEEHPDADHWGREDADAYFREELRRTKEVAAEMRPEGRKSPEFLRYAEMELY